MITIVKEIKPLHVSPGQFMTQTLQFVSTISLNSKMLNIDLGVYFNVVQIDGAGSLFEIFYTSAGTYEMNGRSNWKCSIEIIDDFNFKITLKWLVTKSYDAYLSSASMRPGDAFFVPSDINSYIWINLKAVATLSPRPNQQVIEGGYRLPVNVSATCKNRINFALKSEGSLKQYADGYTHGKDLTIEIKSDSSVGNNYYIGFYREDAVVDTKDIVKALGLNLALINSGINAVDAEIPITVFSSATSFKTISDYSQGTVKIDGDMLAPNATYRAYVVFSKAGTWYTCVSDPIIEVIVRPPIIPSFSVEIEDNFGTVGELPCAHGLLPGEIVSVCVTPNEGAYTAALADAGMSGTFASRLLFANAFIAKGPTSTFGISLPLESDYCASFVHRASDPVLYMIFEFVFQMDGYRDKIYKVIELNYNHEVQLITPELIGPDEEPTSLICADEEGIYTISNLSEDCINTLSVNSGSYGANTALSGNTIDSTKLAIGDSVCILSKCSGDVTSEAPTEPDPEVCTKTIYKLVASANCPNSGYWDLWYTAGSSKQMLLEVPYNGSAEVEYEVPITVIWTSFGAIGCQNTYDVTQRTEEYDCSVIEILQDINFASVDYEIDTETGEVTINLVKNLTSPIESEDYLVSFDGGITFTAAPSSVIGEESILVVYRATFTDNSTPIQIEQPIAPTIDVVCENTREIEATLDGLMLEIDITTAMESDILLDNLYVEINGAAPIIFDLLGAGYTPSIELEEGDSVLIYTYTIFDDECAELLVETTLVVPDEVILDCPGYAGYELEVLYNEETGVFTINKTGTEETLEINELLWTSGNGLNPFDVNKSGIPYTNPIKGDGFLLARWRIKLPMCKEIIIDAFNFGKKCCDPVTLDISPYGLIDKYIGVSGYQFTPVNIETARVVNPATQLKVLRNTEVLTYVAWPTLPADVDEYTINATGQYETWSLAPLDGEDLTVIFKGIIG